MDPHYDNSESMHKTKAFKSCFGSLNKMLSLIDNKNDYKLKCTLFSPYLLIFHFLSRVFDHLFWTSKEISFITFSIQTSQLHLTFLNIKALNRNWINRFKKFKTPYDARLDQILNL